MHVAMQNKIPLNTTNDEGNMQFLNDCLKLSSATVDQLSSHFSICIILPEQT